jgi:hypothetical protein
MRRALYISISKTRITAALCLSAGGLPPPGTHSTHLHWLKAAPEIYTHTHTQTSECRSALRQFVCPSPLQHLALVTTAIVRHGHKSDSPLKSDSPSGRCSTPLNQGHTKSPLDIVSELVSKPSRSDMSLGLAQLMTEISTRSKKIIFLGSRARPVRRADSFSAVCLDNVGSLTSHNHIGLQGLLWGQFSSFALHIITVTIFTSGV